MSTARPDWPKLAPAPRHLPFSHAFVSHFGNPLMQAACIFLLFALMPFWTVMPNVDFNSAWSFRGELDVVSGRVVAVEATSFTEGGSKRRRGTTIQRIEYAFEIQGVEQRGTSFGAVAPPQVGASIEVEVPRTAPEFSRIRGQRSAPYGLAAALFLLLPLMGVVLASVAIVQSRRWLRLAASGRSALGRTLELKFLRRHKRRDHYTARYEFEFDGAKVSSERKTTNAALYEDARGLRVLVDARDPKRHELVDELPVVPQFDTVGRLRPQATRKVLLAAILPTLILVGYCAWMILMLVG
jgi:hypothetical protein